MIVNINGGNDRPDRVVAAIRDARPDIVALQEINPDIAAALERDLGEEHPYWFLDPQWGVTGMGVIGRFPLRRSSAQLPGDHGIGTPQAVEIDTPGTTITLLNIHAIPPVGSRDRMTWAIGEREHQAEAINAFVQAQRTPVVVAGDMNAPPFHRACHILEHGAPSDVWRECGSGAGFTWPGNRTVGGFLFHPGSSVSTTSSPQARSSAWMHRSDRGTAFRTTAPWLRRWLSGGLIEMPEHALIYGRRCLFNSSTSR